MSADSKNPSTIASGAANEYVMVPEEPDDGMRRAAQRADMDHSKHSEWLKDEWPDHLRVWKAMVAARPKAPPVGEAVAWREGFEAGKDYQRAFSHYFEDATVETRPLVPSNPYVHGMQTVTEAIAARLQDTEAVHASMLQGSVAKITMEQCAHTHGGEVLKQWREFKGSQEAIAAARADERERSGDYAYAIRAKPSKEHS